MTGLILLIACSGNERDEADDMLSRTRLLMGTPLTISVAEREGNAEAVEIAFEEVGRVEALFTTWRDDSELAAINRAPVGTPIPADGEVLSLLQEAIDWSEETGGAFDPAAGAILFGWDLRGDGQVPTRAEIAAMLENTGASHLTIDSAKGTILRERDVIIEEGGFVKGYALDQASDVLRSAGVIRAILDFGGQITVWGSQPTMVGVAHPENRDQPAIELEISSGSVATSSGSERFFEAGGVRYSHLFDPRTGRALPPRGSVTVVHRSGLVADILATALYVMGPDEGLAWAEERGLSAIFLTREEGGAWQVLPTSEASESIPMSVIDSNFTIERKPDSNA